MLPARFVTIMLTARAALSPLACAVAIVLLFSGWLLIGAATRTADARI